MSHYPERSNEAGPSRLGLYTPLSPEIATGRVKRRRTSDSSSHTSGQPQSHRRGPQQRFVSTGTQRAPSFAHLLQSPSPATAGRARELGEELDELDLSSDDESVSGARSRLHPSSSGEGRGNWTYHLEIIQQPQRARACGFGDKDRRPLSPPPIIRLWVKTPTGELVDPSLVNIHFLVLMVDLWSADMRQQRNVVMHPTTSQGVKAAPIPFPPASMAEPSIPGPMSRPGTGESKYGGTPSAWPGEAWRFPSVAPIVPKPAPTISPLTRQPGQDRSRLSNPLPVPPTISGWTPEATSRPIPPPPPRNYSLSRPVPAQIPESNRPTTAPVPARPTSRDTHSSPYSKGLNLPSLASITENREDRRGSIASTHLTLPALLNSRLANPAHNERRVSWSDQGAGRSTEPAVPDIPGRLSWNNSSFASTNTRPSLTHSDRDRPNTANEKRPSTATSTLGPKTPIYEHPGPYFPSVYTEPVLPLRPFQGDQRPTSSGSAGTPANYSRVLVGSLSAVCQRLQDDQGRMGMFFFAHDLGVRTEGTFTLGFRLTDLALMMMPGMPGRKSPVLAQSYSDPFTVYSAKRFPGVIPTTDLTRLFAGQNVRLPTRQRRLKGGSEGASGAEDDD